MFNFEIRDVENWEKRHAYHKHLADISVYFQEEPQKGVFIPKNNPVNIWMETYESELPCLVNLVYLDTFGPRWDPKH